MYLLLLLALSGDIALNPDPHTNAAQVFPCGYCQLPVTWEDRGVACDDCSLWFHISCHDMNVSQYAKVNDAFWKCFRCNSDLLTDTFRACYSSQHIKTRNISSRMSSVSSVPSTGSPAFQPVSASTPVLRRVNATSSSNTPDSPHPPTHPWAVPSAHHLPSHLRPAQGAQTWRQRTGTPGALWSWTLTASWVARNRMPLKHLWTTPSQTPS